MSETLNQCACQWETKPDGSVDLTKGCVAHLEWRNASTEKVRAEVKKNRFIVFSGFDRFPAAGVIGIAGVTETKEQAVHIATTRPNNVCDWWHVLDLTTMTVVATGSSCEYLIGQSVIWKGQSLV